MSKSQGVSHAKDEVEEKLENLVFGDDAGFYESLRNDAETYEELNVRPDVSRIEREILPVDEDDLEEADDSRVSHRLSCA